MSEDRRLRRLERQIWELLAWRNISTTNLEPWTVTGAGQVSRQLRLGDRWDVLGSPVRMQIALTSAAPPGARLEIFLEGDGLVFLDGTLAGAVSPFEREVALDGARQIEIDISPNDSFGVVGRQARLVTARLAHPNEEVRSLFQALLLAWETCAQMPRHTVTPYLLERFRRRSRWSDLPSSSTTAPTRLRILREELTRNLEPARSLDQHYHYVTPLRAIQHLLSETQHFESHTFEPEQWSDSALPAGAREALDHLSTEISALARRFPPVGRLAATSHAHLDVAWLWPLSETRRKVRHTFANVLVLMQRYPDFYFTASSAQLYEYVRQDDPELFERVRARIVDGRWEPIGGMWLEPDCNLTSGESLARHLLYGQRYFEREFGRRSPVAWLPDTFGLTANLPQILAGGGMHFFFTQKLSWNDTNKFPHDLWLWEGLDGTRLTAHSFLNPVGGYNGQVTPESLEATWNNFGGRALHPESLFTFGMGDGGRGPTSEMLERLGLLKEYPALPEVRHATAEDFFAGIDASHLPVWSGELYLEFHRGTYTTQSRLKRLNRMAEHRLQEAETAATLASLTGAGYPSNELDDGVDHLAAQPVPRHPARLLNTGRQRAGGAGARRCRPTRD